MGTRVTHRIINDFNNEGTAGTLSHILSILQILLGRSEGHEKR